jgi:hypothetical protein
MEAPKHVESEDSTTAFKHLKLTKDIMQLAPDVRIFCLKVLKVGKGGAKLQFAMKTPKAQALVTQIMQKRT